MRPQDEPQGVYFVIKGLVKTYFITKSGTEFTTNIYKPGTSFPLIWAIGGIENEYYVSCMIDSKLYRCPKDQYLDFIHNDPEILYKINQKILWGLNSLILRLQYLITEDAQSKVANVMLMLASRFGVKVNRKEVLIDLEITQQEIANLAGLSRETVSLEIARLKSVKIISHEKNKYIIRDIGQFSDFTDALIKRGNISLV